MNDLFKDLYSLMCFPRFILTVSFSDTLLLISILDILDSLLLPFDAAFAVLKGLLIVPVGTMGLC